MLRIRNDCVCTGARERVGQTRQGRERERGGRGEGGAGRGPSNVGASRAGLFFGGLRFNFAPMNQNNRTAREGEEKYEVRERAARGRALVGVQARAKT